MRESVFTEGSWLGTAAHAVLPGKCIPGKQVSTLIKLTTSRLQIHFFQLAMPVTCFGKKLYERLYSAFSAGKYTYKCPILYS